jgi:hypothetical protein
MIGFTPKEIELMPQSYQRFYLSDLGFDGVGDQHDVGYWLENTWVEYNLEAPQSFEHFSHEDDSYEDD